MPLLIIEFLFIADLFLITLTQFEKTGSINKTFISLEILNIKLETRSHDLLLFVGGVCIPFNRRNELNFKNQNANRETSILSMNKLKDFSWKKTTKIRVYKFIDS